MSLDHAPHRQRADEDGERDVVVGVPAGHQALQRRGDADDQAEHDERTGPAGQQEDRHHADVDEQRRARPGRAGRSSRRTTSAGGGDQRGHGATRGRAPAASAGRRGPATNAVRKTTAKTASGDEREPPGAPGRAGCQACDGRLGQVEQPDAGPDPDEPAPPGAGPDGSPGGAVARHVPRATVERPATAVADRDRTVSRSRPGRVRPEPAQRDQPEHGGPGGEDPERPAG